MKRTLLSLVLAVLMVCACFTVSVFAGGSDLAIEVGTVTAAAGSTVDVPVTITSNNGVAGITCSIEYDKTALTLKAIEYGSWEGTSKFDETPTANPVGFTFSRASNYTKTGVLMTLTFEVSASAAAGSDHNVKLTITKSVNQTFKDLAVDVTNGKVSVNDLDPIPGTRTFSGATVTYDGKAHSLAVSGTTSGCTIEYKENGKTDAGTYTVTATVKKDGYKTETYTAKLVINKAALTVSGLKAVDRDYDGTKNVAITGGSLVGVVSGDSITATYPTTGTVATSDAENGKKVTFSAVTISGTKAANYTLTQPSLTVNINPITVAYDPETKSFDLEAIKNAVKNEGKTLAVVTDPEGYEEYVDLETGAISDDLPEDVKTLTVKFGYNDGAFKPIAAAKISTSDSNNAALIAYLWYIYNKGKTGTGTNTDPKPVDPVVVTTKIALKANAATTKYMEARNGKFEPTADATRYEVIKALNELFDITTNVVPTTLKDVDAANKDLVSLFTSAGIIDGFPSDNTFRGTAFITRGQFCKIVCTMLGLDTNAKDAGFNDTKDHWAASYINACAAKGLVEGKGDGKFAPDANITRAELATLINRITGAKAGTACAYTDVPADAWYFGAVAAAAK